MSLRWVCRLALCYMLPRLYRSSCCQALLFCIHATRWSGIHAHTSSRRIVDFAPSIRRDPIRPISGNSFLSSVLLAFCTCHDCCPLHCWFCRCTMRTCSLRSDGHTAYGIARSAMCCTIHTHHWKRHRQTLCHGVRGKPAPGMPRVSQLDRSLLSNGLCRRHLCVSHQHGLSSEYIRCGYGTFTRFHYGYSRTLPETHA